MKSSHIFLIVAFLVLGASIIYLLNNVKVTDKYNSIIEKERVEKNEMFKNGEDSPLTYQQKIQFNALNYFPIDKQYLVEANFELNPMKETIRIGYSDGSEKLYLKYGFATFNLLGTEQKLTVLKPTFFEGEEYLFLAFYDETSTAETYGGGRYIDLDPEPGNTIKIDFNLAYNPYCAYNTEYRCPLPPKENQITIAVKAGEKKYDLNH